MRALERCGESRVSPKRLPSVDCRRSRNARAFSFGEYVDEVARRIFGAIGIGYQISIRAGERRDVAGAVPLDGRHFCAIDTQSCGQESCESWAVAKVAGQASQRHV